MKYLRDLPIQKKLLYALLLASLIPLILVASLSFFTAERIIFDMQINQLETINQQQLDRVNQIINTIDRRIKEVQTDPAVLGAIKSINKNFQNRASLDYQKSRNRLNSILQIIQRSLQFEDIYLINLDGKIIYASDTGHAWQYLNQTLPENLNWTTPTSQYGFSYTQIFLNDQKSGNFNFLVKAPLYDQTAEIHGHVVFEVSLLPLYNIIESRVGLGKTGESVLLQRKSNNTALILSPMRFNKSSVLETIPFNFTLNNNHLKFNDYKNQNSIGILSKINKLDYYILTMINEEEVLSRIYDLMYQNDFIVIVATLLITLFSYWLSKQMTRPLQSLAKATLDLKEKNFDVTIDRKLSEPKDEIGSLAKSFQQMVDELKNYYHHLMNILKEVETAKEEAISANQAKSQFLTSMSHEFRTPLNAIIGYSELLTEENRNPKEILDLKKIASSAKQLLDLINGLLEFSKIEAGKTEIYLEEISIIPFVTMVANIIEPTIKKDNNTFILDCPRDIGTMTTDSTRLRQCLLNLLSNSTKFTTHGEVRLSIRKLGDFIEFSVSDNGIGMTEEQQSRIFHAFTQAEAATTKHFGGTGLGLYLTKNYTEMLGGTITVKSKLEKGTTFTIRLPVISKNINK